MRIGKKRIATGLCLASVGALSVAGVSVAASDHHRAQASPAHVVRPLHRPAARISARAHAAAAGTVQALAPELGAFRRAPGAADVMPQAMTQSALLSDGVADPSLARRTGFSRPAWILPSSDGASVCVATQSSLACGHNDLLQEWGLQPSESYTNDGPIDVTGVAVDSVTSASLVLVSGEKVTIG
jgi:hypothetical protein